MNQQQAESVKDLAKDAVETLGVVVRNTKKPCKWCGGKGTIWSPTDVQRECHDCDGTGKIKQKWNWEPKVGEWCIVWGEEVALIYRVYDDKVVVNVGNPEFRAKNVIPILHWEELERVLKEVGYYVFVRGDVHSLFEFQINKSIGPPRQTRQEAVMESIIKLGEEIK